MTITVSCPSCATSFPVDPAKIPEKGVKARCSACGNVFRVEKPAQFEPAEAAAPTPDEVTPASAGSASAGAGAPPAEPARPQVETGAPDSPEAPPGRSPEGEPVGGFDVGSASAAEPAQADAGDAPGGGDWVIEREPGLDAPADVDVEPMETVESSQGAGYFGGPAEGIETTAPAETPAETGAGDGIDTTPEPMVTGGFETGGFDGGAAGTSEAPPAEPAPPESPTTPETPAGTGAGTGMGATQEAAPREAPAEEPAPDGKAPDALPTPNQPPQGFQFGKRDPHDKARRLARVLVSDMIMYNPERHTRALEQGTLHDDFEDEISKSWEEYVDQVGDEIANGTNYFNEALNDILAKGQEVFHGRPNA